MKGIGKSMVCVMVVAMLLFSALMPKSVQHNICDSRINESSAVLYHNMKKVDMGDGDTNSGCSSTYMDNLDQSQTDYCGYGYITWGGGMFAQSFVPTMETLTKVELYMAKIGSPTAITISIRSSLYGNDMASTTKYGSSIPQSERWIVFDFSDISVDPGNTYYIVWYPSGSDEDNTFYWGFGDNNPYPNGDPWFYDGSSWSVLVDPDFPHLDFCFKTYGDEGDDETDYWAVIIGCEDYPGTEDDLNYCIDDAIDFKNALLSGQNWASSHIMLLTDCSKSAAVSKLRWVDNQEDSNDIVVFYFSGHGAPYQGHEYIIFSDGGYISDSELDRELDRFEGNVAVILDSCYSGGFIGETAQSGRVILTACSQYESSWEGGGLENSWFTHFITRGFQRSWTDKNRDNCLSAEEIFNFAEWRTQVYSTIKAIFSGQDCLMTPQIYDGYAEELPLVEIASTWHPDNLEPIDFYNNVPPHQKEKAVGGE
ncbi:MAG: hypothetical protein DRN17_05080 [Thermoplasmata archaeon]|nr:MAG: hypothetical protein DRN17_05080 [Thermoplasmata archaeon]